MSARETVTSMHFSLEVSQMAHLVLFTETCKPHQGSAQGTTNKEKMSLSP
jgi:hypothetical protein